MAIAGYTYLELQEEVLAHQFQPDKYRPLVKTWLNQAQRRLVQESEIRTQVGTQEYTTVASNKSIGTTPTDFYRIVDLSDVDAHRLLTPWSMRDYDSAPPSRGRPYAYSYDASSIYAYPTPDAAYVLKLHYWKLPQDMSADGDAPEIPEQYQELLIAYAMRKAYLRENDYQAAQVWESAWERGMLKLRGEVVVETQDGPSQVQGGWDDYYGSAPNVWVR